MNWNWKASEQLEVTFPNGDIVRMTLVAAGGYEIGNYQTLMREGNAYVLEKYKATVDQFLTHEDPAELAKHLEIITRIHSRSFMLATLSMVETKPSGEKEWTVSELPEAWTKVETFGQDIPPALYTEWRDCSIRLNPGQFMVAGGDSEKKGESVSVRRLTTS